MRKVDTSAVLNQQSCRLAELAAKKKAIADERRLQMQMHRVQGRRRPSKDSQQDRDDRYRAERSITKEISFWRREFESSHDQIVGDQARRSIIN